MAHEFIPVLGYRTGSVERQACIRHGLAFDLTGIDFRGRAIVSAALELPALASAEVASITLSDPGDQVRYGAATFAASAHVSRVPLSSEGVRDLRSAAGAYFSVDAVVEDSWGEPSELRESGPGQALLLVITEQVAGIADAA